MEELNLYEWQIDFIKDLLREYAKSGTDRDTRLMAKDILGDIDEQCPDVVYETSLLTGELIAIPVEG